MTAPRCHVAPGTALRSRLRLLAGPLQIAASALVLVWTFRVTGSAELWTRLPALGAGWLCGAIVLVWAQVALAAVRWRLLCRRLEVAIDLGPALAEYSLSSFLNQVLPGGVAGDAVRGLRHAGSAATVPSARATRVWYALIADRFSGQLGVWAVALVAWAALPAWYGSSPDLAIGIAAPLGVACAAVAIASLLHLGVRAGRVERRVALRALYLPQSLWAHGGASLGLVALQTVFYWCVARALGVPLTLSLAFRIVPLVLVAAALPAFFAGWGVREVASAALFGLCGLDAGSGAAVAAVAGGITLIACTPAVALLVGPSRAKKPDPSPDAG